MPTTGVRVAPPRPGTIPGQVLPGAGRGGTSIGTWITRIIATVIGLGGGIIILIGILIATGDPAACVDRRSAVSQSAVDSLQLKWDTFKAAGSPASVQFTEAEVTSRGVAYLDERDVPIKDLQVYFCPDGKAEAKGKVNVLSRDVSVLIRGTLDAAGVSLAAIQALNERLQQKDAELSRLNERLARLESALVKLAGSPSP